jgi:hypothetical protein
MTYFAWVKSQQPWAPVMIMPQIIWDEKMADYIKNQGHLDVVESFPISDEEAESGIDVLAIKYPRPITSR